MAIPLAYGVHSVARRWRSTLAAILGIAGTVGVFVATLSLARGFQATLVSSGSPRNAIVLRAGATSELNSSVMLDQVRVLEGLAGVARGASGALVSPEVVVVAAFPLKSTGTDANLQVRGVTPRVLQVRDNVRITSGSFPRPGLPELLAGSNAAREYAGVEPGARVMLGGSQWTVVGTFDAGGSAFDSELWCDAGVLTQVYQRPAQSYQSATVRLTSEGALSDLAGAIASDPRLTLQAEREVDYYAKQSRDLTTVITVLGYLVASIMGVGAVLGALNTMYSAVAERTREIATLRALGFGAGSVIASFVLESLCIALAGGALGCLAVLPVNGVTTGTLNWQTFSRLVFAFRITPSLLATGIAFALLMGLIGGLPPAIRAARLPVAVALRKM